MKATPFYLLLLSIFIIILSFILLFTFLFSVLCTGSLHWRQGHGGLHGHSLACKIWFHRYSLDSITPIPFMNSFASGDGPIQEGDHLVDVELFGFNGSSKKLSQFVNNSRPLVVFAGKNMFMTYLHLLTYSFTGSWTWPPFRQSVNSVNKIKVLLIPRELDEC